MDTMEAKSCEFSFLELVALSIKIKSVLPSSQTKAENTRKEVSVSVVQRALGNIGL